MSKLKSVCDALEHNTEVLIPRVWNGFHCGWMHTVTILVAPRVGIYDAAGLQSLLERLVPDVKPSMMDRFDDLTEHMRLGKLYFDEEIGLCDVECIADVTIPRDAPGRHATRKIAYTSKTCVLSRRTWVKLYPDATLAGFHQSYEFEIPLDLLEKYRSPSPPKRPASRKPRGLWNRLWS